MGIGLAALVAGFATATIKRAVIAHPVLLRPAWNVELAGFVEALPQGSTDEVQMQMSPDNYDFRVGDHAYAQQRAARPVMC